MDPDQTLSDIRKLVSEIQDCVSLVRKAELAEELATSVESLDTWLSNNGFFPHFWIYRPSNKEIPNVG